EYRWFVGSVYAASADRKCGGQLVLDGSNTRFFYAIIAFGSVLVGTLILLKGGYTPPWFSRLIEYGHGATAAGLILIALGCFVGFRAAIGPRRK
ncbi:MAG TPA: hypothetical protein VJY33_11365, partial [Isosphaeraceae bacterium]|nr:hypothetical protein [Isosphaeraceae bacterium]